MRNVHSNVLYCDPNDRFNFTSETQNIQLMPDLEDYCIAVDLEVEIPGRMKNPHTSNADDIVVLHWSNSAKGNSVSFLQGTRLEFPNAKGKSFLTTAAYDFATYEDVWKTQDPNNKEQRINSTNELFGINSIDIEYNNYMVPVITINFTDIRGISLFAPEEIRHRKTIDGTHGFADNDIAGSFFKCFFTFPYPRFKMMVKGFYGEPTAYELTCTDFRARFDSETGNFGATAKFIGYSYSLLGDVTLTALLAAPLSQYKGEDYWNQKIQTDFQIDGKPMPRLVDMLSKTDELLEEMTKLSKTDPLYQEVETLSQELQAYSAISNRITDFINNTLDKNQLTYSDLLEKEDVNGQLVSFAVPFEVKIDYDSSVIDKICDDINEEGTIGKFTNYGLVSYDSEKNVYWFSIKHIYKPVVKRIKDITNSLDECNKQIANKELDIQIKAFGLRPTIENITHILLAHLDTFLYCIYTSANEVDLNRTPRNTNIGNHGLDIKETDFLPPFPKCVTTVRDNYYNVSREENAWIGNLNGSKPITEKELIEGLLKGIDRVVDVINETTQNINLIQQREGGTVLPISIIDLLGLSSPFTDVLLNGDIDDHIGHIAMRMSMLLGINDVTESSLVSKLGEADAHNFYRHYPSLHDNLLFSIKNNKLKTDALNSLTDGNQNEVWGTSSLPFFDKHSGLVQRGILSNTSGQTMAIRIDGFNWENIEFDIDNNGILNNLEHYITNISLTSASTNSMRIIEGDSNIQNLKSIISALDQKDDLKDIKTKVFGGLESNHNCMATVSRNISGKLKTQDDNITKNPQDYYSILPSTLDVKGCQYKLNKLVKYKENRRLVVTKKSTFSHEEVESLVNDKPWLEGQMEQLRYWKQTKEKKERSAIDESSNITITNFELDGKSIFGQLDYYGYQAEGQGLLFLSAWDWGQDLQQLYTKQEYGTIVKLPKYAVLWLGGYLWYQEYLISGGYSLKFNGKELDEYLNASYMVSTPHNTSAGAMNQNQIFDITYLLNSLRRDIKGVLIEYFKEWVKDEFATINATYSLGSAVTCMELKKIFNQDHDDIIESLSSITNASAICKAYLAINVNGDDLVLINRESSIIDDLLMDATIPCLLISPFSDLTEVKDRQFKINMGAAQNYLNNFNNKLKELYEQEESRQNKEKIDSQAHESVKIALYNYIKILWDKWLSGTPNWENIWGYKTLKEHWYYLDSYYNKIGQDHMMNMNNLVTDIQRSLEVQGYSLLTFLFSIYARERFGFYCVQNFMGTIKEEKMKRMFEPIPYHKINYEELNGVPDFVLMYTGEYSNKLDIEGADYVGDSYMIATEHHNELPIAIQEKVIGKSGYKIPAFGVSFGKQYQNYFKTYDVSMDSPIVTEQALRAQFDLVSSVSKGGGGENGRNIIPISPDLYTIYSNNSYTCTIQMMGCAWIQPLMYFQLNNVPMFRGTYLVQKVTHRIVPGDMTTTFVGTRMAKETTPLVRKPFASKEPNQGSVDGTTISENSERLADIGNNCDYKFFNPITSDGSIDEALLLSGATEVTSRLDDFYENYSLLEVLAASAYGAVGGTDKLAVQLTATVHYNRYMNSGEKGFDSNQFFVHNQVEYDTDHAKNFLTKNGVTDDVRNRVIEWVKEIYLGSPAVLVGQRTCVKTPYTLSGVNANQKTESKTLTLEDLQMMNGYATPTSKGYEAWMNGSGGVDPKQINYVCHHTWNGGTLQHIFVNFNGTRVNWSNSDSKNKGNQVSVEDRADDLYNAILSTIKYSKNVDIKESDLSKRFSQGILKIGVSDKTTESSSKLGKVFDIVINTYSDYVEKVDWVVNQTPNDFPREVHIHMKSEDNNIKTYAITSLKTNEVFNDIQLVIDEDGSIWYINSGFCATISKNFGEVNENNVNTFIKDHPNFSFLNDKEDNEKVRVINEILGVKIKECDECMSENASNPTRGFSWQSYKPHEADKNVPQEQGSTNTYIASNAVKWLKENASAKSQGTCALHVRQALENSGLNLSVRPNAACEYVRFLPQWNFKLEGELEEGSPYNRDLKYETGDIAVCQASPNHPYGHIHIYDQETNKWYSDFGAINANPYRGEVGRITKIFRYSKQNDNNA